MENLAYLYVASDYESQDNVSLTFNLGQLSNQSGLMLLQLAVPAALMVMTAGTAQALQRGDSGPTVSRLQTALKSEGFFNARVTGYYGTETVNSVRRFQAANGLQVDGIAGPTTLRALRQGVQSAYRPVSYSGGLRYGSSGAEVSNLQRQLRSLGYDVRVDGIFGSTTDRAVRQFQASQGLTADGVVGSATRQALANAGADYATTPSEVRPISYTVPGYRLLTIGSRGEDVRRVQQQLNDLGYYCPVDGVYGSQTANAVRRFQSDRGLHVDGVAGEDTQTALLNNEGRPIGYEPSPPPDYYPEYPNNSNNLPRPQPNSGKRYIVLIPTDAGVRLSQVRRYVPDAFVRQNRLGAFIQTYSLSNTESGRVAAFRRVNNLRSLGFKDAQVRYL